MDNVTITFNTLLQLFGAIAIVGGGVKILFALFSPWRDLKAKMERNKKEIYVTKNRLDKQDMKLNDIDSRMEKQDKAIAVIGLSISELINHILTNNDKDKLKAKREELNEFFYKDK